MTDRPPAAEAGPSSPKGLFRSRLRDARIRSKLGLILIIPLIAVVALASVRLVDSGQRALGADQTRSLAVVTAEVATVAHELHAERMAAAKFLSEEDADPGAFNELVANTDEAVEQYQSARAELGDVPDVVEDRLTRVDEQLANLGTVRQGIVGESETTVSGVVLSYGVVLTDFIAYQESVSQVAGDPDLAESIRALAALSKAKNQMSEAQALAFVMLLDGEPDEEQLAIFLATQTGAQESLLNFTLSANASQLTAVNSAIGGGSVVIADRAAASVIQSANQGQALISADAASQSLGAVVNLLRTEETGLHTDQVTAATDLRDQVFQQVLLESVLVLLALAIAIAVAVLLARMLARSLQQLRENALTVAEKDLPETVERLSDPRTLGENTPAQLAAQVQEPIQLRSRDEIGEVAQAFNVVHREAVRVAAEQAALRTSVSAMFLSLARRSQSLVDRMISQLDEIERHEEDPKRLAKMFALDHLATRMRRNDENLLVLAGADSSPPRTDDALVADVLRASQSEVEHYDRIEFGTIDSDVSVVANAVNDTVRLVAELFDNAARFSPPDSAVVCEARRLGDHVIIQIEDRGVGMSQDQVSRLNAWLTSPPSLEVTTFRKMGLAVVARLASRHQIRVELRCDPNYGTIAYVALPRNILVLPRSRTRSLEAPTPRSPLPVEPAPAPAPTTPPVPSRHVGQLPRRSPGAAAQPGGWDQPEPSGWGQEATGWQESHVAPQPAPMGNGQPASYEPAQNHANQETNQFDLPVAGRPLYDMTAHTGSESPTTQHPSPPPATQPPPPPEATVELPIFKEMEQVWFRNQAGGPTGHNQDAWQASQRTETPSAGNQAPRQQPAASTLPPRSAPTPPPAATPPATPPPAATPSPASSAPPPAATNSAAAEAESYQPAGSSAPQQPATHRNEPDNWRTAADFGWRAAAAASQPTSGGATASGLPKRVPQAQLVPGSVEIPTATPKDTPAANNRRSPEEIRGLLSAYHRGVQRGRESGGR
ncbi:sensor histidine kinase [Natronosporangium hydrolyticum]|uniref:histidine kinase n=1 Tax=Natronosporangium hydrolyticum TaxID=2811111 RepID=A0A895YDP3_9ACTN|nr:sensor histidine kinase [Natronosporangium hydrolyticum]QSB12666.1 sensor histidine kinase [Natronosporangium hydrolyticum]